MYISIIKIFDTKTVFNTQYLSLNIFAVCDFSRYRFQANINMVKYFVQEDEKCYNEYYFKRCCMTSFNQPICKRLFKFK